MMRPDLVVEIGILYGALISGISYLHHALLMVMFVLLVLAFDFIEELLGDSRLSLFASLFNAHSPWVLSWRSKLSVTRSAMLLWFWGNISPFELAWMILSDYVGRRVEIRKL